MANNVKHNYEMAIVAIIVTINYNFNNDMSIISHMLKWGAFCAFVIFIKAIFLLLNSQKDLHVIAILLLLATSIALTFTNIIFSVNFKN